MVPEPIKKAVVYLDPHEFHSTWLGNKACIDADGAGRWRGADYSCAAVQEFGEDKGSMS